MDILKKEICFLSKEKIYCIINDDKNLNKELILSPYYYWYFEKKLPVTNIKKAKAIAIQMLENSLPNDNENLQFVLRQKEKNVFDIFVVDYERLITKLNVLGIEKEKVSSISFSHIELEECCISLETSEIFSYQNVVAEIDKKETVSSNLLQVDINSFLEKKQKIVFKHNFSKANFIQKTLEVLDTNFIAIVGILIIVLSSLFIEILATQSIIQEYQTKKEQVLKTQTYATHSIQLKYVMDDVLKLDFKQKNFRKTLEKLIKVKSNKNTFINKIEYDDGDWFIDVISNNKANANNLLKNKKYNFIRYDKNTYKYEKTK